MKKKVVVFLHSLNGGGSERVLINIANGLVAKGYDVDIVLIKAVGDYFDQIDVRINFIYLNARRALLSFKELAKYLKNTNVDVLISPWCHMDIISIMAKIISRSKCRIIITEHTVSSIDLKNSKQLIARFLPTLMRIFYKKADYVVAVSKGVAKDLSLITKIPVNRIHVIYNPIINEQLLQKSRETILDNWFNDNKLPTIISVGRLSLSKDYETLIRAFHLVNKEIKSRLVILGEGEDRKKLEKIISDLSLTESVFLPGFSDNPYKYLRNSDIFVLTSLWEGLGNVIIEAMACGIPVISTDCPIGPAEILNNGEYGTLVPVGDYKALSKEIVNVLKGNSTKVNEDCLKRFDFDTNIAKYIELIEGKV